MAGPRPMQQPPGYPPQQVVYVQQPQKSGFMKGCIIVMIVLFVLGLLGAAGIAGLTYWGLGEANKLLKPETDAAIAVSDDFTSKLGAGDFKGAYALCESTAIKESDLENLYNAFKDTWKGNTGLTHRTEQVLNLTLAGAPVMQNNEWWVTLFPSTFKNNSKAEVTFILHKKVGGTYKIQRIDISGVSPANDGPSTIGSGYVPASSSGSGFSINTSR